MRACWTCGATKDAIAILHTPTPCESEADHRCNAAVLERCETKRASNSCTMVTRMSMCALRGTPMDVCSGATLGHISRITCVGNLDGQDMLCAIDITHQCCCIQDVQLSRSVADGVCAQGRGLFARDAGQTNVFSWADSCVCTHDVNTPHFTAKCTCTTHAPSPFWHRPGFLLEPVQYRIFPFYQS